LRLTAYGRSVILKVLLVSLLIDIIALLIHNEIIKIVLIILSVFLIAFTLYFFRDPQRNVPQISDTEILSPADGKIMLIEETTEEHFLKSRALVIGIFLSPFDVHVNRVPVSGTVKYVNYFKGEFIAAFEKDSSLRNERTEIGIESNGFKLLFKQIAGFVARRIVCELRSGNTVKAGEKFGMIKFGSRVDVLIPVNSDVRVNLNQKVRGGETILAEVKLG
jgi:phosphatidylserine decarboxylase